MRRDTVGKLEVLFNAVVVMVALFGSGVLAESSVWTPARGKVPDAGLAAILPVEWPGMESGEGPRASISGAQTIKDGDSATFNVTVAGGNPTGYFWSFKAPSGAVNSPSVTFSDPTQPSTAAQGHWYALPDSECAPSADSTDSYWNSVYTIVCTVTFADQHQQKAQTTLTVNAYWNPAGATGTPNISGGPTIGHDTSKNLWVVIDAGTLVRNLPKPQIYVPTSSQFYEKVVAHENKHLEQWKTGMLSDLYSISSLMEVLSPLTDSTQEGLAKKLGVASLEWVQKQDREFQRRLRAAEKEAHQVSDPIAPRYCYQYCGA
jgi:hypothetical protein